MHAELNMRNTFDYHYLTFDRMFRPYWAPINITIENGMYTILEFDTFVTEQNRFPRVSDPVNGEIRASVLGSKMTIKGLYPTIILQLGREKVLVIRKKK